MKPSGSLVYTADTDRKTRSGKESVSKISSNPKQVEDTPQAAQEQRNIREKRALRKLNK